MLRMENVHVIRHKHYVEKIGVRRISREMGIDRKTIRKYLTETAPVRHEPDPRSRPVMGKRLTNPMGPHLVQSCLGSRASG